MLKLKDMQARINNFVRKGIHKNYVKINFLPYRINLIFKIQSPLFSKFSDGYVYVF